MFRMRAAHILQPVQAWAPPLFHPPSLAREGRGGRLSLRLSGPFRAARPLTLSRPLPQAGEESSSVLPTSSKPCPSASCMLFPHLVSFHSVPFSPPPAWQRRDPVSRVSCAGACAGGGARIAAARLARLIARARGRHRTHFACRLNRGRSAPDRHAREAAPDASSLRPIISQFLKTQVLVTELLPESQRTDCRSSGAWRFAVSGTARLWTRT